jgi:hypothetical protein
MRDKLLGTSDNHFLGIRLMDRFLCLFFEVLGFGLSQGLHLEPHSISPFFVMGFLKMGSWELFALGWL